MKSLKIDLDKDQPSELTNKAIEILYAVKQGYTESIRAGWLEPDEKSKYKKTINKLIIAINTLKKAI